jgi:hypothetical protein
MLVYATKDIRAFDPNGELHFASMSGDFDRQVKSTFKKTYHQLKSTAFHIQDENCICSQLSNSHVRLLDKKFHQSGYRVQTLTPQNNKEIVSMFPSLPALVIFDISGELAYFGPYSSGYLCGAKNSVIEPIVSSIVSNTHLGALVISDSDGCYCKT